MNNAVRVVVFAVCCFTALGAYVVFRRNLNPESRVPEVPHVRLETSPQSSQQVAAKAAITIADVRAGPYLVYRSARNGEFGQIVAAALDDVDMKRVLIPLNCERAYFDRRGGLCLTYDRDQLEPNFRALLVDPSFTPYATIPIAGYPSRTSLSQDGTYAVSTVFTTGDSYDSDFSTRTVLFERLTGTALPDLEQFSVLKDGHSFKRVDFNFWGVTFTSKSHTFYATLGTKGATYLVSGDVNTKTLTVLRENVECPSLSPNGKLIAFKKRTTGGTLSQLFILDTETWQEFAVPGEARHIDDQVAWLDDQHILYGVTTSGAPERALSVWVASLAADVAPHVFITGASSPSIVR